MGGQRAEDERDGAGVGLDEADSLRGGCFVGDEVAGGGVAGAVGGGVGARTAARTGAATEVGTDAGTEVADSAAPAAKAADPVPAQASEPTEQADPVPAQGTEQADPVPAQATEQADPVPAQATEQADQTGTASHTGTPSQTGAASQTDQPEPAALTDSQIVGRRLGLARQHAGLSVDDVVAATRIRPGMLREIEAGDFIHCGGDVYARGHVRAIAKVVGIDPEPLLTEHPPSVPTDLPARGRSRVVPRSELVKEVVAENSETSGGAEKPKSAPVSNAVSTNAVPSSAARDNAARYAGRAPSRVIRPAAEGATLGVGGKSAGDGADGPKIFRVTGTGDTGSGSARPPQSRGKNDAGKIERHPKSANWTAAMLVALLGLVVFAGVQLVDGGGGKSTTAAAPVAPAPKPAPVKPAVPVPPPAPKGVAVRIAAVGSDSWLYVTGPDGKVLFDKLLPSGSTQNFQDPKQLGVTLGNAAAVHMTLNGKDLAPTGGTGQVVHVTLNPTGMVSG